MKEPRTDLERSVGILYGRVLALQALPSTSNRRILIALAGVPGSGKSTISAALALKLIKHGLKVVILPMDGFHFPKSVLSRFENTEDAFRRRGAPFTFDADAFVQLAMRLRCSPVTSSDDPHFAMHAPSFDHSVQDPIQDDIYISSSDRIVILEGNYLLLDEPPWNTIANLVDERWFVNVPRDIAKQRLIERHFRAGIEQSAEAAAARAEENDIPNGDLIRAKLVAPTIKIEN